MTAVDWSQFRDGDRVRVSFEGTYRAESDDLSEQVVLDSGTRLYLYGASWPKHEAVSAELIERPFMPPKIGKLFKDETGALFMSVSEGFRPLREADGDPVVAGAFCLWDFSSTDWRDSIEVLDV